ncbi:CAP domain-containing protein [Trichoderma novae-zelandiae]
MKSAAVLLAAGALLASAVPLEKRVMQTDWVTDVVTVTVTVDPNSSASAAPTAGGVFIQNVSEKPAAASPEPVAEAPKPVYAPAPPLSASPEPSATPQPAPQPAPQSTPQSAPEQAPEQAPPPAEAPKPELTTIIVPAKPSPPPAPAPAPSPKPAPSPQPVVAKPSPAPAPKPAPSPKPAPAPSSAPAPAPGNDYGSIMVNQHNVHRANHSAPALEWDNTLAGYAQITAQGCVFAHDMSEGGGGYGQNLASWGSTGDIDDKQIESARRGVTDQWYNDEMENWTFYGLANPPSGSNLDAWGHYTQLIWKSSTKVGCYTAKCPAGTVLSMPSWYTVCNYSPPGNFGGRYAENVLKPLGQPTVRI